MTRDNTSDFKQKLDQNHNWPDKYMFKFIVPAQKTADIMDLFQKEDHISTRESKNGKYICVTARCLVASSEEVLEVYEKASQIEGVFPM
ncbi:MAG: DUF493 family protein [Thermodesulfobacteriota bacterium]